MKRVLFVCTANICRSPAAAAIFNALASDSGMDVHAKSAGVDVREGRRIAPEMISSLEEVGIQAGNHGATQVSKILVEEAYLVLTMNKRHIVRTKELLGNLPEYIHILPEYATGTPGSSIADPYGYTMPAIPRRRPATPAMRGNSSKTPGRLVLDSG